MPKYKEVILGISFKKIYLDVADPTKPIQRKQVLLIMVMLREIIRTGNTVTEKKIVLDTR